MTMTTAYKLTDSRGYTRRGVTGETLWRVGAIVQPQGKYTGSPCRPGCLHAYISPEVAVLADPIHAGYLPGGGRLFRVTAQEWRTDGLKRWTTTDVTVHEELTVPTLSPVERVAWAICLAPHASTRDWAVSWLTGRDRSAAAAAAARVAGAAAMADVAADVAAAAGAAAGAAARAAAADVAAAAAWSARAWVARAWAAEAALAAAWAARAWASRAWIAPVPAEAHLTHSLTRARRILAGEIPAEQYGAVVEAATEPREGA